jgi:hypothetical protein
MIRSIRHKGLRRLYEDNDPRGVIAEHVIKLRTFSHHSTRRGPSNT